MSSVRQEESIPVDEALAPYIQPGVLIARHTFLGSADSDKFEVSVIVADVLGDDIAPGPETRPGTLAITSGSVASDTEEFNYRGRISSPEQLRQFLHGNIKFFHDSGVLVCNALTEVAQISEAIEKLTDNDKFAEAAFTWQVTAVGFGILRGLQRALFEASGVPELDIPRPIKSQTKTDPQIRAEAVSIVSGRVLDAYMVMPPFIIKEVAVDEA